MPSKAKNRTRAVVQPADVRRLYKLLREDLATQCRHHRLGSLAAVAVADFADDMCERIVQQTLQLTIMAGRRTVLKHDVVEALKLVLPKNLIQEMQYDNIMTTA